MNVYNVIWADDDIDALKVRFDKRFKNNDIHIIGEAHNGDELELCLSEKKNIVDAVIVDANFNESETDIEDERDTSGLSFTRSHLLKLYPSIPFILFTQRSDEMIAEKYRNISKFREEFPRHKRWFKKNDDEELMEMFEAIKEEVNNRNSTSFKVRNRYQYELNAATLIDGAYNFILEFLTRDSENKLEEMIEPFVRVRRIVEKLFGLCESVGIIPPISSDTNGTARYLLKNNYSLKDKNGLWIQKYYMKDETIMPKPLAQSLSYIVEVTQDGAHSKKNMTLAVDKYFEKTKDTLLLKSVAYILIDIVKWFALTYAKNQDKANNLNTLWSSV